MIDWRWLTVLMLLCSGCGYAVGWVHHQVATDAALHAPIKGNEP